jgi:ABC-2 type transport system permease protein
MSWLELELFAREPITVLFTLALPLLVLYVLGGVFTDPAEPQTFRGVSGRNYYVPAYVDLVAASTG